MAKTAKLAPQSRTLASQDDLLQELEELLREKYSLEVLPPFTVLCEGWTDVGYLELAAALHLKATGVDLLAVPSEIADFDQQRIGIFTPGRPGDPSRGGTPQMVRLAKDLTPFAFTLRAFRGLLFVFDHDDAGIAAAQAVTGLGYRSTNNVVTLDPKEHPKACAKKQICIEDLISLTIQYRFFEETPSSCSIEYVESKPQRIHWAHSAKSGLRDYIVGGAELSDVEELVRLLKRVRRAFELPV